MEFQKEISKMELLYINVSNLQIQHSKRLANKLISVKFEREPEQRHHDGAASAEEPQHRGPRGGAVGGAGDQELGGGQEDGQCHR